MKRIISLFIVLVMLCLSIPVFASGETSDTITLDYIIGKVFTGGNVISNDDFNRALRALTVKRNGGSSLYYYDALSFVYVIVNTEGEVDIAQVDKDEVLAELGIDGKYVDFTPYKAVSDGNGGTDLYYWVMWSREFFNEFNYFENLSSIEILYLDAALYFVSGKYECGERNILDSRKPYVFEEDFYRDVNLDGSVNVKDLAYLKNFVSGSVNIVNTSAADADKDGAVSVRDLAVFKSMIAGS